MTGEHPLLARTGAEAVSPPWRTPFKKLITFLLNHQFVTDGECVRKVIAGSGMGLEMSGDMCDYIFYFLCEQHIFKAEPWNHHRIKCWLRFRDNIFIVTRGLVDNQHRVQLANLMKSFSTPFVLTFDKLSNSRVTMLDLSIFKGSKFARSGI